MNEEKQMKRYNGIVWKRDSNASGLRVSVYASSAWEALEQLESEHGEGNVYSLHNDEEASRLRT
jgi:hypothetical protein